MNAMPGSVRRNTSGIATGGNSAELAWQLTIESDSNARIVKAA